MNAFITETEKKEGEVIQSCPTLCDPLDCSLSSSSIHGIFHARVLEWVAISFSRGSPRPMDGTWVSHIAGRGFTIWVTREVCDWTFFKSETWESFKTFFFSPCYTSSNSSRLINFTPDTFTGTYLSLPPHNRHLLPKLLSEFPHSSITYLEGP